MLRESQSLPFANSGTFRTFLKETDSETARLHHHPCYEMNFVLKGEGVRYIGYRQDYFEEGDLILLAPGVPHKWSNKAAAKKNYSSLVMQWDGNLIDEICKLTPEFNQIGQFLRLSTKGIVLDSASKGEVQKKKSDLLNLPPFEKLILLLQLLNDFSKSNDFQLLSDECLGSKRMVPNSRLEAVLAFVENNYADKITLRKVADLVHMSEGAFSRFFSQSFQKPFFTYLNEYRIQRSYRLLEETDMRINEIGYACGYDCLQFFYRQFMKYTGCAPLDYRKRVLNS